MKMRSRMRSLLTCFQGDEPTDENDKDRTDPIPTPSAAYSARSMSTATSSTVPSGSDLTSSVNISDMSAESMQRLQQYPSFSDRPAANLRVFTYSELRSATRNLNRSLLVYEFMPNRSVDDHLSGRAIGTTLSWPMRLRVALDTARGLKYLHEDMDFQIIFRDLKTSNILLDENWNAKLSDFGMARQGPTEGLTHVSTAVVGTLGYAAPEYLHTGRLNAKSDIWSYGVVLYELITGRRPIDSDRPRGEQKLLDWVKPYLSDANRLRLIVDPRLEGHYSIKSVAKLTTIANRCLARMPKARPRMGEVLDMVHKAIDIDGGGDDALPLHCYGNSCREDEGGIKLKKESKKRFHGYRWQAGRAKGP